MLFSQVGDLDHTHLLIWVFVTVGVPVITILGGIFLLVWRTHTQASQANDAVNHRHLKADANGEPPKAYDAIIAIHNRIGQVAGHVENLMDELERTKEDNEKTHEYIIGLVHDVNKRITLYHPEPSANPIGKEHQ